MPALLAKVAWAWEAATTMVVTRVTVVLAVETSAKEVVAALDVTTLRVKDAEDLVILAEREAWERVSTVEVENVMALAFSREDAEGLVRKIALLEGELAEERRA
jgi:hypothetical protein